MLPNLFWPAVKKIVLLIEKNFWKSISNKQTVFKWALIKLKKDPNPITFLDLWTRTVEFYFHYFFARFISLSHKEKSFIRHNELKIKIDSDYINSYILRRSQNFAKSSPYFCPMKCQSKVRWRLRKILWFSQNISTLDQFIQEVKGQNNFGKRILYFTCS